MERKTVLDLLRWKNKPNRKPLILQGARQVGKTWLLKEFGRLYYDKVLYINFDDSRDMREVFEPNLDVRRIIATLEAEGHIKITPENTLIIFDEIQECNRALVSLKYFCENAPEYHIIGAGSFLGVAMHQGNSFPVGKADMLTLYPLSFFEFLTALGETGLVEAANALDYPRIAGMKSRYIELLKHYFYVGGMPEAVLSFSEERDFEQVREIQRNILRNYQADFSKHISGADIPKVGMIWNSVPAQLAREKKKFLYADVKQGARAREYENALQWLINSGLVYQINRVNLPKLPLISYQEREHFKLYMLDTGLLSAMASLDVKTVLVPDAALFSRFKGALTEQYVLQELKSLDDSVPVFYWTNSKNTSEIDFILQKWDEVIPLEVKAGINLKAKSLTAYRETFKPATAVRSSLVEYGRHGGLFEIPLYLMELFSNPRLFNR
jgi:predicted AAA+ superfamily ATPase